MRTGIALELLWLVFLSGGLQPPTPDAGKKTLLTIEPTRENPRNSEGDIIELRDGRLCLIYSRFTGGGATWSKATPSTLASPLSPASMARIPWTEDLVCVWNDHGGTYPFPAGKRTPLCLAVSRDEGTTWSRSQVIEADPDGWYCYTSITFVQDRMLLAYCAGDRKIGGLNRLKVLALARDWLTSHSPE